MLSENLSNSSNKKIYFETAFNYNRTFAEKHDVGAMFLYMQKETQYHNNALPYRKQGLVGRVTYGYDGRYFLEGNFGYTGSETRSSDRATAARCIFPKLWKKHGIGLTRI